MGYRKPALFLACIVLLSCSKSPPDEPAGSPGEAAASPGEAAASPGEAAASPGEAAASPGEAADPREAPPIPLVIVKPGTNPLWFELTPDGPELIVSPEEASLTPFVPWPLSRMIAGMLIREGRLIAAVNREGFLVAVPQNAGDPGGGFQPLPGGADPGIALYRMTDEAWDPYTVGALFLYGEIPGALLYRDDFFIDSGAPVPSPRVWALLGGWELGSLELPALAEFSPAEGWDVDALREGRDGFWYYRAVRKDAPEPDRRYFRSPDLSRPGEPSSVGAFRNAQTPRSPGEAPVLLRLVLERIFDRGDADYTATVMSPEFRGSRQFSAESDAPEPLIGFFVGDDQGREARALVTDSGGRGVYGKMRGEVPELGDFSLPPLPEGFVYTRIGLSGPALIAAWEEQADLSVGAAGFMVIAAL